MMVSRAFSKIEIISVIGQTQITIMCVLISIIYIYIYIYSFLLTGIMEFE